MGKCNPSQSVCGFTTYELDIESGGKVLAPSYDSFYTMNNNDPTVQVTDVQKTETCIDINGPYQTCMTSRDEIMSSSEGEEGENNEKTFCECRGTSEEGDFILLCSLYDSYKYCDTGSNCATVLFGQNISQYGYVTSEFRNFEFVTADADDNTDTTTNTDEESNNEGNDSIAVERTEFGCSVLMNGQKCQKCELTQCDNEISEDTLVGKNVAAGLFNDISIDCSNVIIGGNDDNSDGVTDELLDNGGSSNTDTTTTNDSNDNNIFNSDTTTTTDDIPKPQQTIPPDAFPPTVPPVTQPTSPPNESPPPPTIPPIFLTEDTIPSNDSVSLATNTTNTNTTKDNDSVGIVDDEDNNNNNSNIPTIGDNTTAEQNTTYEVQESSGSSLGGCLSLTGLWSQLYGVHIIGIVSSSMYFLLP